MKFKIIFIALLQINLFCGAEDKKLESVVNLENKKETNNPIDIKNLNSSELGKLYAYNVIYENFKTDSKNTSELKIIQSKVSFILKQPFRDLMYDINVWHEDGIKEVAFINAVKEVQRKFNEKADGLLTFSQYQKLQTIANIYKTPKDVYVGGNFMVRKFGETAFVTGTLEIVDEEIANPINYHSMLLNKKSMICRDSNFHVGENSSGVAIYLDETNYEIISWEDDEVVCKKDYTCRSEKLIINFKSKSVDLITTNREDDECKDLPKLKSARVSRIIDPFKKRNELDKKNIELTRPFISDTEMNRLKEIFKD